MFCGVCKTWKTATLWTLFERASGDPRFRKIVDQKTNSDAELLQLSQNSDCDQIR